MARRVAQDDLPLETCNITQKLPFPVVERVGSCHSCGNRQARNGKCRKGGIMHDTGPLEPGAFVRIFHHGRRFTAISLLAATLSSCGTFTNPGAPKQSFDIDKDIQELETVFSRSGSIAEYYAEFEKSAKTDEKSAKTDEQRKKGRDRFITGRLVLINIHYRALRKMPR